MLSLNIQKPLGLRMQVGRCKRNCIDCIDYAARRIHNHDNATRVAQHNAQLLPRRGCSTVYHAQNNSRAYEIMLANEILTLLCQYLRLWSVGSGERPKMREPARIHYSTYSATFDITNVLSLLLANYTIATTLRRFSVILSYAKCCLFENYRLKTQTI